MDTELKSAYKLGQAVGMLIEELELPEYIQEVLLRLIPLLSAEQLDELLAALRIAAEEKIAVASSQEFQAEVAKIDSETKQELAAILENVSGTPV